MNWIPGGSGKIIAIYVQMDIIRFFNEPTNQIGSDAVETTAIYSLNYIIHPHRHSTTAYQRWISLNNWLYWIHWYSFFVCECESACSLMHLIQYMFCPYIPPIWFPVGGVVKPSIMLNRRFWHSSILSLEMARGANGLGGRWKPGLEQNNGSDP